ncbi:MAG TPA: VWA containing CoxE family protein, partial [Leptospiraceae bacterium]|nr:VWA containing CoxE family protein [Leptospiraceae bacterium]
QLKAKKIPVSTAELIDLLKAIDFFSNKNGSLSINEFYSISRNCLIKDVKYYDDFDQVFAEVFKGQVTSNSEMKSLIEEWLKQAIDRVIPEEQKKQAKELNYEDVFKELQKRLQEQKERHDGGNKWVGTRGVSPFGNSGFNPNGVRAGGDSSGKTAFDVIDERKFRDYRTDETLNVRQIKVALKKLRNLKKEGRLEFSIQKTIDKTTSNGGELELVYERSRKNDLKLLLLMDVGGSMTPHANRVSKLFSASHQLNHFKEFHYYYFHNIIYDAVFTDASMSKKVSISKLTKKFRPDTKVIYVGDASMHPYELFNKTGMYDFYGYGYLKNTKPEVKVKTGFDRMRDLTEYFKDSIWLNPDDERYWHHETVEAIWGLVPMFFLSIDGLDRAIKKLLRK